jgi:hypothetical protein
MNKGMESRPQQSHSTPKRRQLSRTLGHFLGGIGAVGFFTIAVILVLDSRGPQSWGTLSLASFFLGCSLRLAHSLIVESRRKSAAAVTGYLTAAVFAASCVANVIATIRESVLPYVVLAIVAAALAALSVTLTRAMASSEHAA